MNGSIKPDIRESSLEELELFLKSQGEPVYRAKQVYDWIWKRCSRSWSEMSNISKTLRALLEEHFSFNVLTIESQVESSDGTIKFLFELHDGKQVEGVLIPSDGRTTACISSQVGCQLGCKFCATGQLGFGRNLTFYEIFDQVAIISAQSVMRFGIPLSNIVYMGMGEPLMNYEQVQLSVEKITSEHGLGMSPQRITVSSVGLPDMIRRMADDGSRFHFALSLHAARNEKRSQIIPMNKKYPLEALTEALKYYHKKLQKRITIEFILFKDFNDSLKDAADLALFCRSFPVKINLIEYNPVENSGYHAPDSVKVRAFSEFLEQKNIVVNIRKSRGSDIAAACGQLAAKQRG